MLYWIDAMYKWFLNPFVNNNNNNNNNNKKNNKIIFTFDEVIEKTIYGC